jgi:hypothetical protein
MVLIQFFLTNEINTFSSTIPFEILKCIGTNCKKVDAQIRSIVTKLITVYRFVTVIN